MKHFIFFFFFFLLSLLFHIRTSFGNTDFIKDTCKRASQSDPLLNYNFCITVLQSDPRSPTSDLPGLGSISIKLAIANATETESRIKDLLAKASDPYDEQCLEMCSELYSDAISYLGDSLNALQEKRYDDAKAWVSSVMDDSGTCEGGFGEKEGHLSPLTEENSNLFQFGTIALAIINFLG